MIQEEALLRGHLCLGRYELQVIVVVVGCRQVVHDVFLDTGLETVAAMTFKRCGEGVGTNHDRGIEDDRFRGLRTGD